MAKTIGDYKRDYAEARARGDADGMKAANDGANAIRAQMGAPAEVASADIDYVRNQSGGGSSSSGGSRSSGGSSSGNITAPGSTGGAGSRSNGAAAWQTYRDDNGDIDYSVQLRNAMEAGNSDIDYLTNLINSRTDKAINKGMTQYANDDFTKEVWEYINGKKADAKMSALAQQEQYYEAFMDMVTRDYAIPEPDDTWKKTAEKMADAVISMKYDDWAQSDQYKALADRYGHQGKLTMQDILGQISARTGGLASSYATTAAQQQYNEYMAQLEGVARQMYAGERQDALQNAQLAFDFADNDYQRYLDQLSQFNKDRSFGFDVLSKALDQSRYADEWKRTLELDARSNFERDRAFEYQAGQDALDNDFRERQWRYGMDQDSYAQGITSRDDARNRIVSHIEMGGSWADLDPALITQSGLTTVELQTMMRQARQGQNQMTTKPGNTTRSGSGKTSGSGKASTGKWDAVEDWVGRYGDDAAEDYIKENYKALGYSSQSAALSGWRNHQREVGNSGSSYDGLLADLAALRQGGATANEINQVLLSAKSNGIIDSNQLQQLRGAYVGKSR